MSKKIKEPEELIELLLSNVKDTDIKDITTILLEFEKRLSKPSTQIVEAMLKKICNANIQNANVVQFIILAGHAQLDGEALVEVSKILEKTFDKLMKIVKEKAKKGL